MLLPRLVARNSSREPVTLAGQDRIGFHPLHARDAMRSIDHALRLDCSHTINVGGAEILSSRAVSEFMGGRVRRSPHFDVGVAIRPVDYVLGTSVVRFKDEVETLVSS